MSHDTAQALRILGLTLILAVAAAPITIAQDCPVPTEEDNVLEMMQVVAALDLNGGLENALVGKLSDALVDIVVGDFDGALSRLEAFVNQVEAQSGKQISAADAELLIASAETVFQLLQAADCPCVSENVPGWQAIVLGQVATVDFCLVNEFVGNGLTLSLMNGALDSGLAFSSHMVHSAGRDVIECVGWIGDFDTLVVLPGFTQEDFLACADVVADAAAALDVSCGL